MPTYTKNYNLDKYEGSDAPNLLDQYNAAMDKIDTQLATNANNTASVGTLAQGYETRIQALETETAALESSKAPTNHASATAEYGLASATQYGHVKLYESVESQADGAVTPAAVQTAIQSAIAGIDPTPAANSIATAMLQDGAVTGAKIAAGTVTASNLNSSAIQSILQAFPVHYFYTEDPTADNEGMTAPTGVKLEGFYIEYIELLILTRFSSNGTTALKSAYDSGYNQISLPNYVPRVTQNTGLGASTLIKSASLGTYSGTTGLTYIPGGYIGPNSAIPSGTTAESFGSTVWCFRTPNAGLSTLQDGAFIGAIKNNGLV